MIDGKNKDIKILVVPTIFFIILIVVIELIGQKLDSNSGLTRVDDIIACIKTWRMNPVLGSGYLNINSIISNISVFRKGNKGISSSFFIVLAQGRIIINFCIFVCVFNYYKEICNIPRK